MIKIISDSSTLYTVSEAKDKGFYSVPLHVTIGNDSYRDLEDISSERAASVSSYRPFVSTCVYVDIKTSVMYFVDRHNS